MKAVFLRVGADSTKGGGRIWSPIGNGRFYWIPIPGNNLNRPYASYLTAEAGRVIDLMSKRHRERIEKKGTHHDPEFEKYTYGMDGGSKDQPLKELEQGDLLIFYSAFRNYEFQKKKDDPRAGYYIIGFFEIERDCISWAKISDLNSHDRSRLSNNAHFIARKTDQTVVIGCLLKSKLFQTPLPLSLCQEDQDGSNYYPNKQWQDILGGYNRALNRSSPRVFSDMEIIGNIKREFDRRLRGKMVESG